MIRTFSSSLTGYIHVNGLGNRHTHKHTHITDKNNLKKSHAEDQHMPGLEICKDTRNLYLEKVSL